MTIETMRKAIDCLGDEQIAIGGGEPTIHPLFWQILGECIAFSEYVWLATNGSMTNISLTLAKMAKRGIIGCDLSQDEYHDFINPDVIAAFTKDKKSIYGNKENDFRGIRDVSASVRNYGRAKENELSSDDTCCCSDLIVEPDGSVQACGCDKSPCFGNVNSSVDIPTDWQVGECCKDQEVLNGIAKTN